MLTAHKRSTYLLPMEQTQAGGQMRRVDTALSRLESMVDERLRNERARSDELAARLARLEQHYEELKKVATDVESRLERAMEYIRSLLAADQQ
jgi:DNA-binding protein H-NS